MTHLQNKLDNILVILDGLVFDGLSYDDVHVKAFRDVCGVYQYGKDRKIHGFVVRGRDQLYNEMMWKRGNPNYKNDPFFMIHEIHSGFKNPAIDVTVRQIASYLETFMCLYAEENMQRQADLIHEVTAQLRIHESTIAALKIRSIDTEVAVGKHAEMRNRLLLMQANPGKLKHFIE